MTPAAPCPDLRSVLCIRRRILRGRGDQPRPQPRVQVQVLPLAPALGRGQRPSSWTVSWSSWSSPTVSLSSSSSSVLSPQYWLGDNCDLVAPYQVYIPGPNLDISCCRILLGRGSEDDYCHYATSFISSRLCLQHARSQIYLFYLL